MLIICPSDLSEKSTTSMLVMMAIGLGADPAARGSATARTCRPRLRTASDDRVVRAVPLRTRREAQAWQKGHEIGGAKTGKRGTLKRTSAERQSFEPPLP